MGSDMTEVEFGKTSAAGQSGGERTAVSKILISCLDDRCEVRDCPATSCGHDTAFSTLTGAIFVQVPCGGAIHLCTHDLGTLLLGTAEWSVLLGAWQEEEECKCSRM